MLPQQEILTKLRASLPHLRTTYHVSRLGVFGSYARNTATQSSDIDLVVEFSQPIGLRFMEMSDYLEQQLGKKIDILTEAGIQTIRQTDISSAIRGDAVYV